MSYTSWIEAVKSVGLWVESPASEKAKEKTAVNNNILFILIKPHFYFSIN